MATLECTVRGGLNAITVVHDMRKLGSRMMRSPWVSLTITKRNVVVARAGGGDGRGESRQNKKARRGSIESGYFADVDPNATIYPVRGKLKQDPTKRGGRWESDFVWNSDWKEAMDYEESLRRQKEEIRKKKAANTLINNNDSDTVETDKKGRISLASKIDLNDMHVDLSEKLRSSGKKRQEGVVPTIPVERRKKKAASSNRNKRGGYAANPSTQRETKTWDRSGRYARKAPVSPSPSSAAAVDMEERIQAEEKRYEQLKLELQTWSLGLTALCLGSTFVFYGRDVAASYAIGALGGLLYLRSLSRSMDSFGVGGVGGGPRLLIPIILALTYNRYNILVAESSGIYLQLLPILAGFFTYKGAVVARQSVSLFEELTKGYRQSGESVSEMFDNDEMISNDNDDATRSKSSSNSSDGNQQEVDVTSVDRAFNRNMLFK
eukprot:jgi/Picsp_1/1780/NSC_05251-R1_atp synthase protein i